MAGKKGRSGPSKGNTNALKNGSRISRSRLVIGELSKEMLSVRREGRTYRRELEAVVMEVVGVKKVGDIPTIKAHLIDTASAATIQAAICRWLLRNRIKEMKVSDIRGCGDSILKAKQIRDAAVKALDLDAPPPNPWTVDVESEVTDD